MFIKTHNGLISTTGIKTVGVRYSTAESKTAGISITYFGTEEPQVVLTYDSDVDCKKEYDEIMSVLLKIK